MDASALEEFGFTRVESTVYLALLSLGESKAGPIARNARLNRTTTYYALEKLVDRGFANFSSAGRHKVYRPVEPRRLVDWLDEKREKAIELMPLFSKLKNQPSNAQVLIFRGRKGVKEVLRQVLDSGGYVSFGAGGQFWETMQHDFYAFQKRKKWLKVKSRVIAPKSAKGSDAIKESFAEFKFLSDEFFSPSTTWVYDNNVAIAAWSSNPLVIVMTDASIAGAFKKHFELLWKVAKR